ncbi:5-methylcytosine rRNA methyltransferase nsun4 [Cichlidogyrus casuarinus]|uniref:5-methylcytosine rRNA methyltransferase nsun4 n=1 Tax=Cichlidogyrus casuarinus TaxID=1844966 RepID=A0ABD2QN45_9PLAT
MAELPTKERESELMQEQNDEAVLFGDSYVIQQRLAAYKLKIPFNPKLECIIQENHIAIALLRDASVHYGIAFEPSSIRLPSQPIRSNNTEEFYINVKLKDDIEIPIRCQIFHYQRLDKLTCTYPEKHVELDVKTLDDWQQDIPKEKLVELARDPSAYRYRALPKSVLLKSIHIA